MATPVPDALDSRAMSDRPTVKELRERFAERDPTPAEVEDLRADPRKGVVALLASLERRKARAAAWAERVRQLDSWREKLAGRGYQAIGGVDEAGRGPLAGPVFTACVVLGPGWDLPGLDDSKKLTAEKRARLEGAIQEQALGWCVAWADPEVIDRENILEATRLAMMDAVQRCRPLAPDFVLTDAVDLPRLDLPQRALPRGDSRVAAIAAASILAKEARDRHMKEMDLQYPGYGFAEHKGYGTAQHMQALADLGPSPIHRRSFAPVGRWVLPTLEELRRRLRRARTREGLREIGQSLKAATHDLTPRELEELREEYRTLERGLR